MEITINIKTNEYCVKRAKMVSSAKSCRVNISKRLLDREVLCIPLVSPDHLIVNETDDGQYLINCCGFEMLKKIVKPYRYGNKVKTGYVLLSEEYVTDDILIIPFM